MANDTVADGKRYTLQQAADEIGIRADDLPAFLPDVGIDLSAAGHDGGTLSAEEVARVCRVVAKVKDFYAKSLGQEL